MLSRRLEFRRRFLDDLLPRRRYMFAVRSRTRNVFRYG